MRYTCGMRATLLLTLLIGCEGSIGGVPETPLVVPPPVVDPNRPPEPGDQTGSSALQRLSRREFDESLAQIFGIEGAASTYLPEDVLAPFDTDSETKEASRVFIDGAEALASSIAQQASANDAWVAELAGCSPTLEDSDCLGDFASQLGLRLWRRPITSEERSDAVDRALPFATETGDIRVGVRVVIQSLIQSPEFLYRTTVGSPVDGSPDLRRLNNFELVSRLAALIWGSAPSESLLTRAATDPITDEELVALAEEMVSDERADNQIETFHSLWLGFRGLRVPMALEPAMVSETEALLRRVLLEGEGTWSSMFTAEDTFVTPELAAHYGIEGVTETGWADYQNEQRAGLLSHASMLSLSSRNGNETSPTIRGKFIATQLLCYIIPPPPPDINTDDPPEATEDLCKYEAYAEHADTSTSCFNCHALMDPIGFGLERFDGHGVYREIEYGNASCSIDGVGDLRGTSFSGPRELGELMIAGGDLTQCGVQQFVHFATGHEPTDEDANMMARLHAVFIESGEDFRALIGALVAHPVFRHRVEEQAP